MKKTTLSALYAFLNGDTTVNLDEARTEITAEYEKQMNASKAKADAYDAAKPVILEILRACPTEDGMTVSAIAQQAAELLPEDFTKSKIQYALTRYWTDEVEKIENPGKVPNTYRAK